MGAATMEWLAADQTFKATQQLLMLSPNLDVVLPRAAAGYQRIAIFWVNQRSANSTTISFGAKYHTFVKVKGA